MLCYFWAAGHWNYARYIFWHITDMENFLDDEAESMFLLGDNVCRHTDGSWNAVYSDQFGKQSYLRYGKAKGGLVGLSFSEDQVASQVVSQHVCNYLSLLMDHMYSGKDKRVTNHHKEEGNIRKFLHAYERETRSGRRCPNMQIHIETVQTR